MHFILCIFTLFISCHGGDNEAHFTETPNARVKSKMAVYCEKSRAEFLARKWSVDECDGLLFTSLRGIACGDIDISVYESAVEPGQWYRNPKKDCYVADKVGEQGSDSTISKDMLVGLTAYLLASKNADSLRRTIEYGKSHDWIVGDAKDNVTVLSKCFVTPSLQNLLIDSYNSLGGSLTDISNVTDAVGISTGFRAHLDVLAILVRGKIDGKVSTLDLTILKEQAKRSPRNALFQAAKARYDDGDFSRAEELLLDESFFPSDELPSTKNYCTEYLYQRDDEQGDWGPCLTNDFKQYDGTDFLFSAAVTTGIF